MKISLELKLRRAGACLGERVSKGIVFEDLHALLTKSSDALVSSLDFPIAAQWHIHNTQNKKRS